MRYEALENIHHDGAAYGPGDVIEKITEDQAAILVTSGRLRLIETAESVKPAKNKTTG